MNQVLVDYYMRQKFDLSGSRTKNRFRLELLWGVGKMLDLMEEASNFTVVFDYVCDIEVHTDEGYEFYQVKTHGANQKTYTTNSLVKNDKDNGSILGKLYALHDSKMQNLKLAIVSNIPHKNLGTSMGELSFVDLPQKDKDLIKSSLQNELGITDVNFEKVFYVYTAMSLVDPEDEVKGKLISRFEKIKGSEPNNPNALYRLVFDTVSEKACYEFSEQEYSELLSLKGISRDEFDRMLNAHSSNAKTGIPGAMDYINQLTSVREKRTYKTALSTLVPKYAQSRFLFDFEREIAMAIDQNEDVDTIDEILEWLIDTYHDRFPVEYSNAEKVVFYLVIIHKYMEGGYDETGI